MKKKKSLFSKISNVFLTVVLIILVAVVAFVFFVRISGQTPNIAGYMIFRVSTGSMEPELMVGDVILSKHIDNPEDLKTGDIITYEGAVAPYSGKLITHEIVTPPYYKDGELYVVTKGLANPEPDPPVTSEQFVGVMVAKIPFINWLYSFFLTPWGLLTSVILILLAFSGEFYNIYKLSHEKEQEQQLSKEEIKTAVKQFKTDSKKHKKQNYDKNPPVDDSDGDSDDDSDSDKNK